MSHDRMRNRTRPATRWRRNVVQKVGTRWARIAYNKKGRGLCPGMGASSRASLL